MACATRYTRASAVPPAHDAQHLRQLVDHDGFTASLPVLTEDQVRIVGARYNRGTGRTLEQIRANTSYGDFILKIWARLTDLVA
jgi:hypothetical protein